MAITLFPGVCDTKWNGYPVDPGETACVSPVYGTSTESKRENRVALPENTAVLNDSGAFCDGPGDRLSFEAAKARQDEHADKYNFADQRVAQASYDLLIDEKWEGGIRSKRRWSENDAWEAVNITVAAAAYLSQQTVHSRVQSAQGVTAAQYLECTYRVLEHFDPQADIFGLGGWCIFGKMPSYFRPSYHRTISLVIPALARAGVRRVHIWGVIDITCLAPLLWLCDQHDIALSTDSGGPQIRPAAFGEWGYRGWRTTYKKPKNPFLVGLHRAIHCEYTRDWLAHDVRKLKWYKAPSYQLTLF